MPPGYHDAHTRVESHLICVPGEEESLMSRWIRVSSLMFAVLAVLLLAGSGSAQAAEAKGKLTVAMVNPLSGDAATYGVSHKNGLELAFQEINKAGGVKGQEIELVTHDDAGEPKQAAAGAQKFADQKRVLAITGSCLSSNTLAMVPIIDKAKLPQTVVSSSTPKLSGMSRFFFRMSVQDAQVGILMADLLGQKLKAKKVAILYPNNDYGKGLSAAIEAQLKHHGVAVASNQAYLATDKDYSALLTGIKGSDVDALAVAGTYTDGGLITKQMRGMGFTKPIVGGTGFYSPKLVEIAGPAAEGVFLLGPFVTTNPDPAVREFVKKYKEKYGMDPDMFAALAYDQGYVLKAAMAKAAEKGITRESVRDAMAVTRYKGITGTVTFDDKGDWVRPYLYITVKDGRFEVAQ
jgi:branched-chain amino acid transport system substrate-binding protein